MFFKVLQFGLCVMLFLLSAIEVSAWSFLGKVNGFGLLICIAAVFILGVLAKLSYHEMREEYEED